MLDTGRGVPPGRLPWFVGEGHGPPAGVCGGVGLPGPMQASSPTRRAAWRGNVVSRLPTGPALGRRGGFHIRPGDLAPPQSPRDDASIVPYRGCNNAGFEISRAAASPPLDVGEGFIPPAGVRAAAGPGGMRASRPTAAGGVTATLLAATFAMVRRGGPWPSRKSCAALRRVSFSNILSRPQGGDPPYLNSELFTLNSELPTLNFRPATA